MNIVGSCIFSHKGKMLLRVAKPNQEWSIPPEHRMVLRHSICVHDGRPSWENDGQGGTRVIIWVDRRRDGTQTAWERTQLRGRRRLQASSRISVGTVEIDHRMLGNV